MDRMRKISSVIVIVAMVATVVLLVQVTMNVNDGNMDIEKEMPFEDGRTEEEIYEEIEETEYKALVVDKIIGNRHVKYWEHIIDDICVKNDFILLHTDIENGEIVQYERCWTDVGPLPDPKSESFAPENYYWKQAVVFYDEDDCTYFYTFYDPQEYPVACWEVRHDDGTTVIYDFDGNEIGYGIPAPANGFSLSGYNNATWPDPWLPNRQNADHYFSKWCSFTTSLSMPSASTISTYVSDPDYKLFYELAHGGSYSFGADSASSYYSKPSLGPNNVQDDMASRKRMKLAFIGSCEGMDDTGPGSFSYEFRKGEMAGTVTIGFDGMASCPGWSIELDWQDYMFDKMDDGHTMKAAFDLANANYPTIAGCVVFVGDESIVAGNNPPIADINGPYVGYEGSPINFDASGSYDPDCNTLEYRWDYQSDGTWTAWSTVPTSSHVYGDDWVGKVALEVREKFTSDQFTDSLTMDVTVNNVAPVVDPLPFATLDEGQTITFNGHATDPGSDDLEFTWDWGYPPFSQTVNTYLNNPPNPDPNPSKDINPRDVIDSASQTYGDNGVFPITLTVVDD
ncbi:MAG: hypothetical protein JSW00_05385, partial [Thermoplasmata archaeon]